MNLSSSFMKTTINGTKEALFASFQFALLVPCLYAFTYGLPSITMLQVIELQLPSFFDNFDPRSAAASFPSSNGL